MAPPLHRRAGGEFAPVVQASLQAMGLPCEPLGVPYATEAGEVAAVSLPVVVLGPGDIAQAHTRDEWLDLAQLHRGVEVYQRLMGCALRRA